MDYENIKIFIISLIGFAFALIAYVLLLWNYHKNKIKEMEQTEKDWINDKFTYMHGTQKANHEMQMLKLETINGKVDKINSRVFKLEETTNDTVHKVDKLEDKVDKHENKIERYGKQTKKTRFFESNPAIFIFVIIGILAAINYKQLIEWVKLIF